MKLCKNFIYIHWMYYIFFCFFFWFCFSVEEGTTARMIPVSTVFIVFFSPFFRGEFSHRFFLSGFFWRQVEDLRMAKVRCKIALFYVNSVCECEFEWHICNTWLVVNETTSNDGFCWRPSAPICNSDFDEICSGTSINSNRLFIDFWLELVPHGFSAILRTHHDVRAPKNLFETWTFGWNIVVDGASKSTFNCRYCVNVVRALLITYRSSVINNFELNALEILCAA